MSKRRRSITLVLGGACSGKSRFAQELAAGSVRVAYLATARVSDSEMKRKIRRHRAERPSSWETIEVESNLAKTIRYAGRKTDLLLVECMTTYVGAMIGIKGTGRNAVEKEIEKVQFSRRVRRVLRDIVSRNIGRCVLVVTHAGVIRAVLASALGIPACKAFRLAQDSCAVNVLKYFDKGAMVRCVNV